jgi:hypothetical protein
MQSIRLCYKERRYRSAKKLSSEKLMTQKSAHKFELQDK